MICFHLVFFQDGNAVGIKFARQWGGIAAACDVGNLGCGEGYDSEFGVVAKDYVEIMKISPCSSKDEDSSHMWLKASLDP